MAEFIVPVDLFVPAESATSPYAAAALSVGLAESILAALADADENQVTTAFELAVMFEQDAPSTETAADRLTSALQAVGLLCYIDRVSIEGSDDAGDDVWLVPVDFLVDADSKARACDVLRERLESAGWPMTITSVSSAAMAGYWVPVCVFWEAASPDEAAAQLGARFDQSPNPPTHFVHHERVTSAPRDR
jgi:hypothetical protein